MSRNGLKDVKVVACNKLDLTCAAPITDGVTGADGRTKLSVPDNFAGYIQVTDLRGYAPSMYFLPVAWPENVCTTPCDTSTTARTSDSGIRM